MLKEVIVWQGSSVCVGVAGSRGVHLALGLVLFFLLTGFLPFGQLAYTRGVAWAQYFYAPITKSLVVYITGACLYASKTPERFFPGFFDYVGCSHNIWHVAVLGGIVFHYMAMQAMFTQALTRAQTSCSVY